MASDGENGRGLEAAAAARKPRKRQLVVESSDDSEADEFCISTRRQNGSGAASVGNAGAGSEGGGDRSEEKPVAASAEEVSGVKSSDGGGSVKKTGAEQSSSSQPAAKRIRVENVPGGGSGCSGGASKGGTGGKMLPRGLPTWRFERPEVRGGRVLDEKDGVGVKASSASKMKEQVSSLGDKRRQVELQKHERRRPLKAHHDKAIDSGQKEVLRLQGKRGVLRLLPKNDKVARDAGDGKTPSRKTEVDGETGSVRIPTKRGYLKLLPKNNGAATESNDCKLVSNKVDKVDEETGDGKMPMKNTKVADKETGDGKTLAITSNLDGEFGGRKVLMKNCTVDTEPVSGKFQHRNSKADGETKERYKGYEEKSGAGAPAEFQKKDANGEREFQKKDANGERRGKLLSPIALRKSDPSVVGVSLGQKMKQQNSKPQLKNYSLSLKDDSTTSSEKKNLKKRLLEHKGSSESLSKKAKSKAVDLHGTSGRVLKKPRGGPRYTHKQDLRNKIKRVLLDNGWKIDLRRRKNKDYEDSVYVSPAGISYWSITKAYAVFQEQFQNMDRSSKLNNTRPGASDVVSKDDLALLKKNIVKRRTNKEISGAEKKPGISRSSKDILTSRGSRNKHQNKEDRIKNKDRRCGLLVRGSTHDMEDNMDGYIPYEWKRTVYSWMIDLGVISEDMQVKYMNNNRTKEMLAGRLTREGIFCGCCSKILTVAKFELHAGSKEKKPYANIFLEGGKVSLLQCLLDAWEKHTRCENKGFYKIDKGEDEHDDTCAICGDGGDLVCCDRCASTFHLDCLGIKLPSGDWYCRSCLCRFCGFPQEKPSSSPELLLSCLQCSRKYHQTCSSGTGTDSDSTIPSTSIDCFCSPGCRKIYKRLNKLLGIKNHMEAGFSWSLVRCFANDQGMPSKNKEKIALCNSKIALAFTVLDECFQPHIDERSGINMIHNVAYNCGSDFSRLDFSGFYTFILERGDEVISAASVRIHGTDLAEMPFIGTREMYRHQGMLRRLLNGIESALSSLSVRKLVVSAVTEMGNTWTTVFGFKPVERSKKQRIKSLNLLIMNGTDLLEKRMLPTPTVDGQTTKTANAVGSGKMDAKMLGEASGSETPAHISSELDAADNPEMKRHENPHPLGNCAGSTLDQSPAAEENEAKITMERSSPVSIGDVKTVKLHTLPGANCGVNMQGMVEAENIQEEEYKETNGRSIAENTISEQKCEDKSNSSHSNSLATPMTVDQCPCLSNEIGKGENCLSSELSVGAATITGKTESNLASVHCANQEDEKACTAPVDNKVPLVIMDEKPEPDKHEFKTMVVGYSQSSMEAKSLEDGIGTVNGTSMDTYRDKGTNEDHSASAVNSGVSVKLYVQQTEIIEDKTGSLLPDLKHTSSCEDMLVTLTDSKSLKNDMVEMDDATIKVGMTGESFNEAGMTAPVLSISDAVGENVVKPTQTCGEGQLRGEDVLYSNNSMEDDLASREPVNA